jgi:signal transduction histidine kinase
MAGVRIKSYLVPLAALVVGLPLLVFATLRSVEWLGRPFPGFFVMQNAMVPTVSGRLWPPDRAALFHGQVVAVDGAPVRSGDEVYRGVAARPVGAPIAYALRRDGVQTTVTSPSMRFGWAEYLETWGILLAFAWSYLAVGLIVAFLQPRTQQARVYLLQALVGSIYPAAAILYHQARPDHALLTTVGLAAECMFPATYVHLALVFPIERRFRGLAWLRVITPYLVSAVLVVLGLRGFHAEPPTLVAFRAAYVYTAASIVFFVGTMVVAYVRTPVPAVRGRILAVLPGVVLGTAGVFLIFLNNASAGRDLPIQFGLVPSFAFYVSVAYAIAKHDLFDIDRVLRQSFVYGLLTMIVLVAYALVLTIPAQIVPTGLVGALFVLVLALLLDPLRRGVQHVVDRAFFRSRLDGGRTVGELSEALTSLLDLQEIVARVTQVVTDALQLESTTLAVAEEARAWSRLASGELRAGPGPTPAVVARIREYSRVAPTPLRADDPALGEETIGALRELGAALVLPLTLGDRPLGFLALGPKRSGRPFGASEEGVLRTLANQAAIALQNALSFRALATLNRELDEKVRVRTDELRHSNEDLRGAYRDLQEAQAQLVQSEKMASLGQLVAGVAHELNNPASFVHGSLANLSVYLRSFVEVINRYRAAPIADPAARDALEALCAEAQLDYLLRETPELLRFCAEGSERIKSIVEDLRVFVRAEQGGRVPTDLAADLDGTLRLLSDRIVRAGARVERRYEAVPPVEAHVGQLNQVWMNLLGNAVDAVEGREGATIAVAIRDAGAWVEVEIADNGVGIPPEIRDKIFDPFFTTKPIGRGTGLGLSIAYGAVRSHGGTITVTTEPGHGTTMRVRLPRPQAAPRAA